MAIIYPFETPAHPDRIGYNLRGNRYLNITNRCTLRCGFCPKFNGTWEVQGCELRLRQEPESRDIVAAAGNPTDFKEVVFCGLGEPTIRLYPLIEAAKQLRRKGAAVRINTDGLANLIHGRDIAPDLEGVIDSLSISLNAQNERLYNQHCRPPQPGAFESMLDFTDRARHFVSDVTMTAIDGLPGVDIAKCEQVARKIGVKFRRRVLGEVG